MTDSQDSENMTSNNRRLARTGKLGRRVLAQDIHSQDKIAGGDSRSRIIGAGQP
jgi:hypothetical protein